MDYGLECGWWMLLPKDRGKKRPQSRAICLTSGLACPPDTSAGAPGAATRAYLLVLCLQGAAGPCSHQTARTHPTSAIAFAPLLVCQAVSLFTLPTQLVIFIWHCSLSGGPCVWLLPTSVHLPVSTCARVHVPMLACRASPLSTPVSVHLCLYVYMELKKKKKKEIREQKKERKSIHQHRSLVPKATHGNRCQLFH